MEGCHPEDPAVHAVMTGPGEGKILFFKKIGKYGGMEAVGEHHLCMADQGQKLRGRGIHDLMVIDDGFRFAEVPGRIGNTGNLQTGSPGIFLRQSRLRAILSQEIIEQILPFHQTVGTDIIPLLLFQQQRRVQNAFHRHGRQGGNNAYRIAFPDGNRFIVLQMLPEPFLLNFR